MSRPFRTKDKDLVRLEIKNAEDVWVKDQKGRMKLRTDIPIYGKIEKGQSSFITSTNLSGGRHRFVDDTCNLPKNLKSRIVYEFNDNNKRVLYLIKPKESDDPGKRR